MNHIYIYNILYYIFSVFCIHFVHYPQYSQCSLSTIFNMFSIPCIHYVHYPQSIYFKLLECLSVCPQKLFGSTGQLRLAQITYWLCNILFQAADYYLLAADYYLNSFIHLLIILSWLLTACWLLALTSSLLFGWEWLLIWIEWLGCLIPVVAG